MKGPQPPRLAAALLRLMIPESEREFLLGDLEERWRERVASPRAWYWGQTLRTIGHSLLDRSRRPLGFRKPSTDPAPLRPHQPGAGRGAKVAGLMQDARFALRVLSRRPLFAAVVIVTLGLGIGASTAMFSVVHGVLLRPLPYRNPDELVKVWQVYVQWEGREGVEEVWDHMGVSYPQYESWRRGNTLFHDVAIFNASQWTAMALSGAGEARRLSVGVASASLLPTLGVEPVLGRGFLPEEEASDPALAGKVAIVSHHFWTTAFGGAPDVLGKSVSLDGEPFTVVGVLPPGFHLRPIDPVQNASGRQDLWIPAGNVQEGTGNIPFWDAVGRLKPGVSLEQATEEVRATLLAGFDPSQRDVWLVSREEEELGGLGSPLLLLLIATGVLLLIGCVNVAALSLSELAGRRRELVTRAAVGAGRTRIVRQLLTESALLGLMGSLVGVLVAEWGTRALVAMAPPIPRIDQVGVDLGVLGFAVALGMGTGLLFGVLPALLATRPSESGAGARVLRGSGSTGLRLQSGMVGLEVALTVVLLVTGGLLGRSLSELMAADPGFDSRGLATVSLLLPENRYTTPESQAVFTQEILGLIAGLPGVEVAAATSGLPFPGDRIGTYPVGVPGRRGLDPDWVRASAGYLEAMGIALAEGRGFTEADGPDAPPVALISESFARRRWPGESPLGATIAPLGRDARTVVGVVADVRKGALSSEVRPTFYTPLSQEPHLELSLVARTAGDAGDLTGAMREAVAALDTDVPVTGEATLSTLVSWSAREEQYRAMLMGVFGALATVLAAAGIFGVTARGVAHRTRELGIRMALGAGGRGLVLETVRASSTIGLLGLGVGLIVSLWAGDLVSGFLFGVESTDPLTYGCVAFFAIVVSLLASYLPARRISAVDPARVLKAE